MERQDELISSEEAREALQYFVDLLSNEPEIFLFSLLMEGNHDGKNNYESRLRDISKLLFKNLEKLALLHQNLETKTQDAGMNLLTLTKESDPVIIGPLSGVSDLILSHNKSKDITMPMDVETIWGQVDLQNTVLMKWTSREIRQFTKFLANNVDQGSDLHSRVLRLVDLSGMLSEEDEEFLDGINDEKEVEDSIVTLRMHQRMERVMDEDDYEGNDGSTMERQEGLLGIISDESHENTDDEIYDPAAEKLNDGFFDLHEVEAFADDEEAMVLDNDDTLDIDMDNLGDDVDSDAHSELFSSSNKVQRTKMTSNESNNKSRRRYREDEDVDALMALYNDDDMTHTEDDEAYITMTAKDYFGPKKKRQSTSASNEFDLEKEKNMTSNKYGLEWVKNLSNESGRHWNEGSDNDDEKCDSIEQNDDKYLQVSNDEINHSSTAKISKRNVSKLLEQTERLEKEMLAEKPWSTLGESKGVDRPVNSLLDKTPEFEFATKMAPAITIEHTLSVEDMIKRRILAEDWDDVVARELPDVRWSKRKGEIPEVSQEKSKLSLGELYEREYLRKKEGYDVDAAERQSEEEKTKSEIRKLFTNLCSRLDALSNYHFAPRPIADEAEVKAVSTPAIAMEEIIPLHVSNARVSAPEEIFATKLGKSGILRGESELDQAERKRFRQARKAARRKKRKAKLADEKLISRLQPGLGLNNPYEKRKLREELHQARISGKVITGEKDKSSEFKSSSSFFQKIQADIIGANSGDDFTKISKART